MHSRIVDYILQKEVYALRMKLELEALVLYADVRDGGDSVRMNPAHL